MGSHAVDSLLEQSQPYIAPLKQVPPYDPSAAQSTHSFTSAHFGACFFPRDPHARAGSQVNTCLALSLTGAGDTRSAKVTWLFHLVAS